MAYYKDLGEINIDRYKEILKSANLLPSWMVLKEKIDENLDIIKEQRIENLAELQQALKTKTRLQQFAAESGLPLQYLTVLRRVINGYHPKPNRIRDFPNVDETIASKLEAIGIKNTLKLYPEILTADKRNELSHKTGISPNEVLKLAKLTDLSRVRWVNHTFAYVLLEAGYNNAEEIANANYHEMYEAVKKLNEERKIYNAHIGSNDMKLCVEAAKGLDFEIEVV